MPRKNHPKRRRNTLDIASPTPHIAPTLHLVCRQKRRFPTEKQATYAAETQELQQPGLELKTYQCPLCKGWHLSDTKPSSFS